MNKVVLSVFSCQSMNRVVRVNVGPEDDISTLLLMFSPNSPINALNKTNHEVFNIRLATFEGYVIYTGKKIPYCDVISSCSEVVEAYFKGVSVVEDKPRCIDCGTLLELKPMEISRKHLIIKHMDLAVCIPGYIEVTCLHCQTEYLFVGKPEAVSLVSSFSQSDTTPYSG